jgi:hypothetical protein
MTAALFSGFGGYRPPVQFRCLLKALLYVGSILAVTAVNVFGEKEPERIDVMLGVDANYSLDRGAKSARWKWNNQEHELFAGMQKLIKAAEHRRTPKAGASIDRLLKAVRLIVSRSPSHN